MDVRVVNRERDFAKRIRTAVKNLNEHRSYFIEFQVALGDSSPPSDSHVIGASGRVCWERKKEKLPPLNSSNVPGKRRRSERPPRDGAARVSPQWVSRLLGVTHRQQQGESDTAARESASATLGDLLKFMSWQMTEGKEFKRVSNKVSRTIWIIKRCFIPFYFTACRRSIIPCRKSKLRWKVWFN